MGGFKIGDKEVKTVTNKLLLEEYYYKRGVENKTMARVGYGLKERVLFSFFSFFKDGDH